MTRRIVLFFLSVLFSIQLSSPVHAQSDEAIFWQSISASTDPAEFCAYLQAYPDGKFAMLANLRLKKLGGACAVAKPAPVVRKVPVPAPAPATPRPTTPPTTAEMESAHRSLTEGEIAMVGFPRSTPPYSEFTIKQCFDCAEVQVICKDKTISGAHQLGGVKVAVMDWPTAGPTLGWVKQFNGDVLEVAPDSIFGAVTNGLADCAAFGGGMLRYGNWDRDNELAKLGQHLNVAPPAPLVTAAPAPAPSSGGGGSFPPISEANGPLCEFYGEGGGWKVSAGFDRVSVMSMDARETFQVHNGFEANGIELSFTEHPDSGAKEVEIDIFNVEKNGEVVYDRLEGEYTKHKYIDGTLTLAAGGETTTVTGKSHVFEFFSGGSSIGFDLPGHWMIGKLRAGYEISIELSLQGSRAASMVINTDTFIDAFRHTSRARSKMADNLANGRCGFGASAPTASSGILGCTSARDRAPGNVEGIRFAVIPGSQKDSIKNAVKDDPRNIEIFDAAMPVYETISNLGGYFEGVAFYDRDIRKRNHPIDGGPLVIGEMVNLSVFKQLAEQSSGAEFRCELLVAMEVCPHPKTPEASQPCN
ncbi:MAG: hypothetical protein JJ900_06415 [Rhodospirillales bacterium]|nr:hypothetical protein [Rhodospirillales bacterium]MBO6786469.1 hypothetical protein [Rhodospirillales bacterium]